MKIAHIAPLSLPIPPRGYGGTERIIYDLVLFQKKRGHDVVIFGMKSGILQLLFNTDLIAYTLCFPLFVNLAC